MGKYLSAELYKVNRRFYPKVFLLVVLGLVAFFLLLFRNEMGGEGLSAAIFTSELTALLSNGLYLALLICDMVFSEQYKHNTLKNEVSYGLPRTRIYLGKLAAAILMSVVLCAIILAFYLGLSCLLFPLGEGMGGALMDLGQALLVAFPLWLGGVGLIQMLLFLVKGSTATSICYVMLLSVGNGFLELLSAFLPKLKPLMTTIQNCLLITPFRQMQMSCQPIEELIPYAWVLGMCWFVLSTAIGVIFFQKREIS